MIFKDIQAATQARRELNGFPFFGKPLKVNFAKARSHLVEKQEGTFDEEAARKAREKRKADEEEAAPVAAAAAAAAEPTAEKRARVDQFQEKDDTPPNKMLFVQNLPPEATELMVQMLFQQFPNFVGVKMVEAQGMAFVEFADEASSTVAKNALQNFKIKDSFHMMISFLKND